MWIHYRRTVFRSSSSVQSCLQIPDYISAQKPSNLRQATSATSFLKKTFCHGNKCDRNVWKAEMTTSHSRYSSNTLMNSRPHMDGAGSARLCGTAHSVLTCNQGLLQDIFPSKRTVTMPSWQQFSFTLWALKHKASGASGFYLLWDRKSNGSPILVSEN